MNTVIERHAGGPCSLEDFADRHALTMRVRERALEMSGNMRFYARFDHVDVAERGMLVGVHGNGRTPEEAIASYAREIVGKRLKFAHGDRSEYIECPNEFLPSAVSL